MILFVTQVDPYVAALIGAGAAILGGALVAGSNLLTTAMARRHERELQQERDERELRQAVRLVLEELSEIERMLLRTAASQLTWQSIDRQLPEEAWARHRATLAAYVTDEAWRWVAMAYERANAANWRVVELEREFESTGPIHFVDKEWLRESFFDVFRAMEALEQSAGFPSGLYSYTGNAEANDVWEAGSVNRLGTDRALDEPAAEN